MAKKDTKKFIKADPKNLKKASGGVQDSPSAQGSGGLSKRP